MKSNLIAWGAIALAAFGLSAVGVVAIVAIDGQAKEDAVHERMVRDEPSPLLAQPVTKWDQWRVAATADGGAPVDILDEVDGGTNDPRGIVVVDIVNENSTCVNCGSRGQGDSNAVDINTGKEIGTAAGCVDGPFVTYEGRADDLGCTSQGASVLLKVQVGRQ